MRRTVQWLLLFGSLLCLPFAQARDQQVDTLVVVSVAQLPTEARDTLLLIKRGGPFPYARDGIEFKNRERILPPQPRNYYREYTVKTSGVSHRGARRIVCGFAPARGRPEGSPLLRSDPSPLPECYYSADHYRSFKRIKE